MSSIDFDFSNLNKNQILLFKDVDEKKLQSYIKAIDEIKNLYFENINFVPEAGFVDFDTERVKMYADALKDVDAKQSALLLSTQGLTNAEIQQVLAQKDLTKEKQYQVLSDAGLLKTTQKLTLAEIQETLQSKLGSKAKAEETMKSMGLSVAIEGEENQTVELTAKKLQLAVASGKVTQAEALEIAAHLGIDKALDTQNKTSLPQWLVNLKSTGSALKKQAVDTINWAKALPLATKALAGVGIGIGVALIAYRAYKNHLEEVRQATEQSATTYKESASSIDDYVSRYQDLQTALRDAKGNEEETYAVKQQLLDLQTELNDKFGDEYGKLNLVTDAYRDQTEAIKELSKAEANRYLNENRKGISTATKKMEKDKTYSLSYGTVSAYTDEGEALQDIASSYADKGMVVNTDESTGMMTVTLTADAQTAYDTINDFETDLRNKAKDLGNEKLFDSVFTVSSDALNNAKSVVDEYGNIYQQALMAELVTDDSASKSYEEAIDAVETYNQAVLESEDPFNDTKVAEAKANLQAVKSEFANTEELSRFSSIFNDVFDQADTRLLDFNEKLRNDGGLQKLASQLYGKEIVDLESMSGDGTEDAFDKLIESAKEYGLEVEDVIDALVRLGYVQDEVANADIPEINAPSLDNLNDQIDSIQSAYKGLLTAAEEYNQYGYITADTLQTLLALDSQYIACLVDENGQLVINGTTYQNLVKAKLADAEATAVKQAIEELGTITTEQQISADSTAIGVMAQKGTALATLTGQYASLANVAISAAEAQALADAYTDASSKNKSEADRVMSNLNAKLALIQSTAKSTAGSFGSLTNHLNGFTDSSGKAKNSTDALTESMEKQKSALESTKSELEKQKQYYEDVASAIDWFYDKQIEKQETAIENLEKEIDLIQSQIDIYDGALSAIDRFYEKQIEELEKKKDALSGNNKEVEAAINLEKRQQELLEARSKKTIGLYSKDKGIGYVTDTSAIKTAEENLAEAQRQKDEADIDAQIDKLKEYQSLWAEIPSVKEKAEQDSQMIQLLGAEWESILLEGRIQNITAFKDQYVGLQQQIDNNESMIASYEEKIAYYESLKTEWDNLLNKYTEDTYTQLLIGAFGNDFENELLNGRTGRWTQFADDYYNIQVQLKEVTDQIESLAKRMEEYASRIESAANSAVSAVKKLKEAEASVSSSSTKLQTPSTTTWTAFDKADMVTRISGKAKGGIVTKRDAGDLDFIAKDLGEDHTMVLQEGEAVIPKETVAKNPEAIDSLLSGQKLDLKSLVNRDIVLQRATPMDTYSMLEKYQDWIVPDSVIMSRLNLPSQDFSKLGVVNNNQQQTVIQINGDLSFPNIKSGNDAELLLKDLSNMANKARQRSARR